METIKGDVHMAKICIKTALAAVAVFSLALPVFGQVLEKAPVNKWVSVTGVANGLTAAAQDEAVKVALRKAVEEGCGVFLTSSSKAQDYKLVYDKIFANAVGYIREYKVTRIWTQGGKTYALVSAYVSTQKFEQDWAVIAHTISQENNPRVIIAVSDATYTATNISEENSIEAGTVQGKLEEFFLEKGIKLMDRETSARVNKRDIMLAGLKDDARELAALGSRFKADVVIYGQAAARYGNVINVGGSQLHQFTATLNIRAIRTDSAQLLVSKTFGPVTANTVQAGGGREKALAKLAEESAPELLKAVVEAWRKQVNVTRDINLNITGLTFEMWEKFEPEAKNIRGVQALRLREITEGVANIDVEYEFDTQALAKQLKELKDTKLEVTEFNPNRIKLKVVE